MKRILKIIKWIFAILIIGFLSILIHSSILLYSKPLEKCGYQLKNKSIPVTLIASVLAQEDALFFNHKGIDSNSLYRALLVNLKRRKIVYGASTIDMQVASICYVEINFSKWIEKVYEMIISYLLNLKYEKYQILQAYLTKAPLGENIYGFEDGSQHYFGKELGELEYYEELSLVLTLRSKKRLNPRSTNVARNLPEKIRRQWLLSQLRRKYLLDTKKNEFTKIPYVKK